jgi:hypothetical protein
MNSFTTEELKLHDHPVWRAKADITLNMRIDSEDGVERTEQLWARRRGGDRYEICCIPFFIYDLALGDVVRITPQGGRNIVEGVVETAGHHTFRVWFGDGVLSPAAAAATREQVLARLEALGCAHEWFSDNLLAIDAPDDATAVTLADYLLEREEAGQFQYETGRTEE